MYRDNYTYYHDCCIRLWTARKQNEYIIGSRIHDSPCNSNNIIKINPTVTPNDISTE